jgi:hypothetical protein
VNVKNFYNSIALNKIHDILKPKSEEQIANDLKLFLQDFRSEHPSTIKNNFAKRLINYSEYDKFLLLYIIRENPIFLKSDDIIYYLFYQACMNSRIEIVEKLMN